MESFNLPWNGPLVFRRAIKQDLENERHRENSLNLWILEAKCLPAKKRYFCELNLDRTLFARTSTKQMIGTDIFWGEVFDLSNLPDIQIITVNIFRETEKKKKNGRHFMGCVNICVDSINSRLGKEQWYTAESRPSNGSIVSAIGFDDSPPFTIRIRARFQSIDILPLQCYSPLQEFLVSHYMRVLRILEKSLPVKAKEDIAVPLVSLFQRLNKVPELLANLVQDEVERIGNNVVFRGNSLATKSMECYMKLVGTKYLQHTLVSFVKEMLTQPDSFEVDPEKVTSNSTLSHNQQNLYNFSEILWTKILHSFAYFPCELREVFITIRQRLSSNGYSDSVDNLITASLFLRFICPAIMSPSLFGLSQEYPDERIARNCTLIAKVIQSLANASRFEGKEGYMNFMNPFIEAHVTDMRIFLQKISNKNAELSEHPFIFCEPIDLSYVLAVIHILLSEYFAQPEVTLDCQVLTSLVSILVNITRVMNCEDIRSSSQKEPVQLTENSRQSVANFSVTNSQQTKLRSNSLSLHTSGLMLPQQQDVNKSVGSDNDLNNAYHENMSQECFRMAWQRQNQQEIISPYACVPVSAVMENVPENFSRIVRAVKRNNDSPDIVDGLFPPELRELLAEIKTFPVEETSRTNLHENDVNSTTASPLIPRASNVTTENINSTYYSNAQYMSSKSVTPCNKLKEQTKLPTSAASSSTTSLPDNFNPLLHSFNGSSSDGDLGAKQATSITVQQSLVMSTSQSNKSISLQQLHELSLNSVNGATADTGSDTDWSFCAVRQNKCAEKSGGSTLSSLEDEVLFVNGKIGKLVRGLNSPAVRMGVRSVQRMMQDKEKSKSEYESEIELLTRKLHDTQERLSAMEQRLQQNEQLQQQQHSRPPSANQTADNQVHANIMKRLQTLENELMGKQFQFQRIVFQKDQMIEEQQRRIHLLEKLNMSTENDVPCSPQQLRHHYNHHMRPISMDSSTDSDSDYDDDDNIEDALKGSSASFLHRDSRHHFS